MFKCIKNIKIYFCAPLNKFDPTSEHCKDYCFKVTTGYEKNVIRLGYKKIIFFLDNLFNCY